MSQFLQFCIHVKKWYNAEKLGQNADFFVAILLLLFLYPPPGWLFLCSAVVVVISQLAGFVCIHQEGLTELASWNGVSVSVSNEEQ